MNRGMKKASGQSDITPNTRADVTVVKKDGKINQFEVPSTTDDIEILQKRMDDTRDKLPLAQQGTTKFIHITKENP